MADNISIQKQLIEHNPFISPASPASPFDNKNSDLALLNSATSEEIEQLLRSKRREPELPLAGLILGEPGTGKTHMLARILRRVRKNASPIVFVAVKTAKTFTNHENITQDLWCEILSNLAQTHSGGHSQFDMLLSRMMDSYHEHRINDGIEDISKLDVRVYLNKDMLDIDKDFLKCIMLYLGTTDELTRLKIFEWLRDGLEDEESLSLGLPSRNLHSMTSAAVESTARKFMMSLGCVLAYSRVSMVVCFDQLEAIRDKKLIHALGDAISMMMNELAGILPLCFSRRDIWKNILRPELDSSAIERLEHHKMMMQTCTLEQAKQLVKNRLASEFQDGVEEKYNWLIERMKNTLTSDRTPRAVIDLAYRAILTPITNDDEEIFNTFKNIYDTEYTMILDKPNTWLPNAIHLTSALNLWLSSHNGFETSSGDGKYIRLLGNYNDKNYAFVIITAKNNSTATAGIKRGVSFLKEYKDGICFYITEAKTHKSTWKRFADQQAEFEALGGKIILLDNNTRSEWYALTSLINQVESGDVNLYLSTGTRQAKLEDLPGFVNSLNLIPGLFTEPTASQPPQPQPPKPDSSYINNDELKAKLASIIKSSPMKLITADKALALLADKKILISRNELLAFVNSSKDAFRVYPSKSGNDIMFALTGK